MVPLWKILHLGGVDWTYGTKGWAAENYCMFIADDEACKHIVEVKAKAVDDLGCIIFFSDHRPDSEVIVDLIANRIDPVHRVRVGREQAKV